VIPSLQHDLLGRRVMMGRLNHEQGQLFYTFCLEEAVPDDHLVRKIDAVLDLSWVHAELAPSDMAFRGITPRLAMGVTGKAGARRIDLR
jgi:hypothetical protein